jgi:pantothenate kinase type III
MKLLLDPGGTRLKWALISEARITEFGGANWQGATTALDEMLSDLRKNEPALELSIHILKRITPPHAQSTGFDHWIATCEEGPVLFFDPLPLAPFSVEYVTGSPGSDRIAAAAACHQRDPGGSFIIIDAGTCITVDLLSPGAWRGGAILPGLNLQAQAMAKAGLPVLAPNDQGQWPFQKGPKGALGTSTYGALEAGISWATLKSVEATSAALLQLDPCAQVILTGGDALHFDGLGGWRTFADPNLVLSGGAALLNSSLL